MPTNFSSEYHRSRLAVVVCSGLVFLWKFNIPIGERIPLLIINIKDDKSLPYIFACVLLYGIFRLIIEWVQSEKECRRRVSSKIDFFATIAIGLSAGILLAAHILSPIEIPQFPLIPALTLIILGIATGRLLDIFIFNLFLIRSKEEARRLALPRIPVAVRATFRLAYVVMPALFVALSFIPIISPETYYMWWMFLCVPFVIQLLASICDLSLLGFNFRGWRIIPNRENIYKMRRAFDRHDAAYQVGGWDKPIPPSNTPLFNAAEQGDNAKVKNLLDAGASPDEPNMHGWTALMIAAAQQQRETAKILLESGADPNRSNLLGRNPLMFAARYGNLDLVKDLIAHGAMADLNESNDPNALCVAATNGYVEIVRLLLEKGANPTTRDYRGKTAIDYAEGAGQGEIASILRRNKLNKILSK